MSDGLKPVAFLGTSGGVCFSELGFHAGLQAIGLNTGNAMFQYALWQRIKNPKIPVTPATDAEPLRGNVKALVIPAANQVNPVWDLEPWAQLVEQLDCPVLIVGLGAQAPIEADPRLELKPGTIRFLKLVAERAKTIGVRGEFTQRVLEHLGIRNTIVTGCPSQHINPHVTGETIAARLERARTLQRPKMVHIFGTMEEEARSVERTLFRIGREHDAQIVYQTNPDVLRYLYDGVLSEKGSTYLKWEGAVLSPGTPAAEYARIVKWKGRFYSDARSWIDAMSSFDVAIGMRIHGAIAAIQGGSLGVCVAFDSRTKELVETMTYPHVTLADISGSATLPELLASVSFDPATFNERRIHLRSQLDQMIARLGSIAEQGEKSHGTE